jgi:hypothetical protein
MVAVKATCACIVWGGLVRKELSVEYDLTQEKATIGKSRNRFDMIVGVGVQQSVRTSVLPSMC